MATHLRLQQNVALSTGALHPGAHPQSYPLWQLIRNNVFLERSRTRVREATPVCCQTKNKKFIAFSKCSAQHATQTQHRCIFQPLFACRLGGKPDPHEAAHMQMSPASKISTLSCCPCQNPGPYAMDTAMSGNPGSTQQLAPQLAASGTRGSPLLPQC